MRLQILSVAYPTGSVRLFLKYLYGHIETTESSPIGDIIGAYGLVRQFHYEEYYDELETSFRKSLDVKSVAMV
jgi:hypothetical protein